MQSYYRKIDFKLKYILVKDFIERKAMPKVFNIYYSIRGRHFKLFTNCHVSWDTLQQISHPVKEGFKMQDFCLNFFYSVGQKWSIANLIRSKNTLSELILWKTTLKPTFIFSKLYVQKIQTQILPLDLSFANSLHQPSFLSFQFSLFLIHPTHVYITD